MFTQLAWADNLLIKWQDLQSQYNYSHPNLQLKEPQTTNRHFSVFHFTSEQHEQSSATRLKILSQLQNHPQVEWAIQDGKVEPQLIPSDEYYPQQQDWLNLISLPETWDLDTQCENVVIAVIDSGVDITHPDLQTNLWRHPLEIANDGIDNDGNGYVDDVHGWNTINENNNLGDRFGHGTHVAGTIGATTDNQQGVSGVCWSAQILAVKFLDSFGSGQMSNAAQAIDYVLNIQSQFPEYQFIINNSWTAPYNLAVEEAFKRATEAGMLIVNAAGNSGQNIANSPTYPAIWSRDNLSSLTVANHDSQAIPLDLNRKSNYDPQSITLAAPGTHILSTWPMDESVEDFPYEYKDGTSMATPVVSGIAALLWHKHPTLNASEIRAVLEQNSQPLDSLLGKVRAAGYVNSAATLNYFESDISSLGYLSWQAQQLLLKGVNLNLVDRLRLNNSEIEFERVDDSTLHITQPNSLRCGNFTAVQSDQSTANTLYFDWSPNTPTDLNLSHNFNGDYTLSWQSDANVDQIEVYTADAEGNFALAKTLDNQTQTATLTALDSQTRIKVRAVMQCWDQNEEPIVKLSPFSEELSTSQLTIPKWLTTALSTPVINQFYYQPLHATDADTFELSDSDENLPAPRCLPSGLEIQDDVLMGTVHEPQNCHFHLIARNVTSGIASKLKAQFEVIENDSTSTNQNLDVILIDSQNRSILRAQSTEPLTSISLAQLTPTLWQIHFTQEVSIEQNQLNITLLDANFKIESAQFSTTNAQATANSSSDIRVSDQQLTVTYANDQKISSENGMDQYLLSIEVASDNNTNSIANNSDDSRCFIASSVYQSHTAPQVEQLREIRDSVLKHYPAGEQLIAQYYQWSPPLVEWMKQHPTVAKIVRPILQWQLEVLIRIKHFFS